ncbi:TonB-dependent receptor domain-containing protein [Hydrogenophaga electricum]|uniref:TonB-dependent receptor n=1 Tax=Hydrogenophaga electricum TaxID=1230953 RepID=A0ABQ6C8L1_9BURK|nr:TonB-dependent receptor [Hydrogenophaga electricum]GLS16713.1 TonB-dependent receptor [Hydrogenophaga electricum]
MTIFRYTPCALALASCSMAAWAEAPPVELETVVVVANKQRESVERTAASVSAADAGQIEDWQATTLHPVLRAMPNVELGGGPRADGLVPTIRGASGASITLLLDGARQNDLQSPAMKSPLYADPYFLRQVEVLRGAASALYGTGGNGGVLALTTLSARDLLTDGHSVGGGVRLGHASADGANRVNARVYGGNDRVDALLAVGRHSWGKIRQARGTYIDPNDGDADTGLLKLGVQPVSQARLELSHQFYNSDNLAPNNPQVGVYRKVTDTASIPYLQPTHIRQHNTVLKGHWEPEDPATGLQAEASVYRSELDSRLDAFGTDPRYQNAPIANRQWTVTTTDGAHFHLARAWGAHRLSVGGDHYRDALDSASGTATLAVNPVNPAGIREGTGLYGQAQWALAPRWTFTSIVRHDRFQARQQQGTVAARSASRLSPKATLAWASDDGWLLYGSYGEGFRAPAVNELYQRSTFGTFTWFLPNTDLRPEVDRTAELGAKFLRRDLWSAGDRLSVRAAVFDSRVRDLITSVNLGNIPGQTACAATGLGCRYQYQNMPHARRQGAEVELAYRQGLWQYQAGYGRVRVTDPDAGQNLFAPPDKLVFQVQRQWPAHNLSVSWNSTLVAAQDRDSTVLRRRNGYSLHDVFVSRTFADDRYRVDVGITNLFDKAWVAYQSGNAYANTFQEGRSFKVAFHATF